MQRGNDQSLSILFVCLGNICRSPMAEGAFRARAAVAGLRAFTDSVGTAAYHVGESPDPRAIDVAQSNGIDISGTRGRQLAEEDFNKFTHIVALDTANLAGIEARAPRGHKAQVSLLLDVFDDPKGASVADPYYGNARDFENCWSEISNAAQKLVMQLEQEMTDPKA